MTREDSRSHLPHWPGCWNCTAGEGPGASEGRASGARPVSSSRQSPGRPAAQCPAYRRHDLAHPWSPGTGGDADYGVVVHGDGGPEGSAGSR